MNLRRVFFFSIIPPVYHNSEALTGLATTQLKRGGIKKEKPRFGARKIRELFKRKHPDYKLPALSTVHAVLDRNGLVTKKAKRRKYKATGTGLSIPKAANDLWCADYKGQFKLGNKKYCYPLTITDSASRYLIACESLETTKEVYAINTFETVFKEYGMPSAIRTDNGVPFASPNALFNLSRLSLWWLRLGIRVERIKPGNPQQNGRHERMHLTLKKQTTRPPGMNFLQQQDKFDLFIHEYNFERPHEGINMMFPSEIYSKSNREYLGITPFDYSMSDQTVYVTHCGRICFKGKKISLSRVFAGIEIGIRQVEDKIWLASFLQYDIGFFDTLSGRFEPAYNPFGSKVLPMS